MAATDIEEGVVSPGGVGYDINCSVRLLSTNLDEKDVRPQLSVLAEDIYIMFHLVLEVEVKNSISQNLILIT